MSVANTLPSGPGFPRRAQRRLAISGRHVQHPAAGLDAGEIDQAFADMTRGLVDLLRPLAPAGGGAVPLLSLPAAELDGIDRLPLHHSPLRSSELNLVDPRRSVKARDLGVEPAN